MKDYKLFSEFFWDNCNNKSLSAPQRYLLAYFMTASYSTQCGIMQVCRDIIVQDTGFSEEEVELVLKELELLGEIIISEETQELMILDAIYFIPLENEKIIQCILKELNEVENVQLINLFCKRFKELNCKEK